MHFHSDEGVRSWGRVHRASHRVARPRFSGEIDPASHDQPRLPAGARRSYGDVGLNGGGDLLDTRGLDRFISFDPVRGTLRAEAGVTFDQILRLIVPRGFFLPVTPGTKFVTLGGAIANDIHGKNHGRAGSFGCHVEEILLLRGDGERLVLRPDHEADLFSATIGGLGLTGTILEASIRLDRIASAELDVHHRLAPDVDALCDLLEASSQSHEHAVAWIDCTTARGRGVVSAADWSQTGKLSVHAAKRGRTFPSDRLGGLLNRATLKAFNAAYYARAILGKRQVRSHYDSFFYPLDGIAEWNRLYGRRGFYQYQALIPAEAGRQPIADLIRAIAASGDGSFLAVLKRFGRRTSPGMMSFPAPGLTLALDFRNRGDETLRLLDRLDTITGAAGGRIYPAKDGRMSPAMFRAGFPHLERFRSFIDPAHQSDFWKRVAP